MSGGTVGLTRRAVLKTIARCVGATFLLSRAAFAQTSPAKSSSTIVVGAGVFGAWTAWNLLRMGHRVTLLDAWGPAHARASSGGESRATRTAYGADEVYTRMAWDSLPEWRWLSERSSLPVFHKTGVLFFFPKVEPYLTQSLEVHKRLGLPTQSLTRAQMAKRWPQISFAGIEAGLFEPELGSLMARRAVQTLVSSFVKDGGTYRQAAVAPPTGTGTSLGEVRTLAGETLRADRYVFACGPWLPKVFPEVLGARIFPTRQEVFFFAPPAGDDRFSPARLPTWADFNHGDIFYGMPDLEGRGFKIAHDKHGSAIDPDTGDRRPSDAALAEARAFMQRRFPALGSRPMVEARVCQYENSSNGDLLIDRHPNFSDVVLVGAGSGHGFKHAPAVGRYAAQLVAGTLKSVQERFSLASKATLQQRAVH